MRINPLRQLLADGKPVLNAWLSIPSSYSAEVLGHQGFDSVTVDLQHGMIGFDAAIPMLQAISATPAVPMVRVSKNDYALVMQLLDAGAYGVICPMISTVKDAQDFVSYCRYPPTGQRSFGPARGLLYGGADYFVHADREILTFAMLETREAVANAEAIVAIDGLDGIYIGPNDLCLAYGKAPRAESDDPEVKAVIADLCGKTRAAGKAAGIFCSSGAGARQRLDEGFGIVTPGNDVGLLTQAARDAIAVAKSSVAVAPVSSSLRSGY
ncbi:MAG: 2,4-dihydroxyhept-2-ene-1,7-dioic acid aldolase [Rhizobiaceae bacterium]|nr:2,4-dihydroxyhept-2-ene-1,7-dioic acid aldolase [Rhizobiaceae bacterium]